MGDRGHGAGLADLHGDFVQTGHGLVAFEFIGDQPAWALATHAQFFALCEVVDFKDDAVDFEFKVGHRFFQTSDLVEHGVRIGENADVGRHRDSKGRDLFQKVHVVGRRQSFGHSDAMAEEPKIPLGRDRGIQQPNRACGDVAGVFVRFGARPDLTLVQIRQIGVGHVDFAAHL